VVLTAERMLRRRRGNLFDMPVTSVGEAKVLATYVEGQECYRDSSLR
jgi:hypothetical protein